MRFLHIDLAAISNLLGRTEPALKKLALKIFFCILKQIVLFLESMNFINRCRG